MSTFKHKLVTFIKQKSAIFKSNYTNFFIDTQVTSAIEVIRDWRLPVSRLIWGEGSPWSLWSQKYLDEGLWFLSHGLETECLCLYSPCFQLPAEIPIYTLSPSLIRSMSEMHAWYTIFFELHRPPKGHSSFLLQLQATSSGPPLFLFNLSGDLQLWLF